VTEAVEAEDDEVRAEGAADRLAGFADSSERAIAEYLENLGRKVTKNPDGNVAEASPVGDANVDSVPHEFRTLQAGATANTIVNMVNNSLRRGGGARRIVIDSRGTGLGQEQAKSGTMKAVGSSGGMIDYVAVIGSDFFVSHGC
jgi:hypothetical protein